MHLKKKVCITNTIPHLMLQLESVPRPKTGRNRKKSRQQTQAQTDKHSRPLEATPSLGPHLCTYELFSPKATFHGVAPLQPFSLLFLAAMLVIACCRHTCTKKQLNSCPSQLSLPPVLSGRVSFFLFARSLIASSGTNLTEVDRHTSRPLANAAFWVLG